MQRVLLVGLGGAVGSCLRFLVATWAERVFGTRMPWGILGVNVVGSFLIAMVAVLAISKADTITPTVRIAIATGFIGGLTTYSSFNQDTLAMFDRRAYALAFGYIALTLCACLAAGVLGATLARRI
jgi:fluoride exporter